MPGEDSVRPAQVNYLGNIGTYRLASEYGMGGAACACA